MRSTWPGSIPCATVGLTVCTEDGTQNSRFCLNSVNSVNKWDYPSGPVGSTLSNAAQDTTDLDHKSMLLVHAQFGAQQHPQVLFHQAALPLAGLQHVLVFAFFPHQVQDLALLITELHEVPVVPFLQPTEVPLDGQTTIRHTSTPSSLANLLRVHSAPSSQLLMRGLHGAGLCV